MTQDMNFHEFISITRDKKSFPQKNKRESKKKTTGLYWFDDPYNAVQGESAIWVAVITQAMMDALTRSRNPEIIYFKNEAIHWLTGNSKDFVLVCLLAGMDPDYVRQKAKKALLAPIAWRAAPGSGKRYKERKAYREKQKSSAKERSQPDPAFPEFSNQQNKVIIGPW
jgi:hypothetical protein